MYLTRYLVQHRLDENFSVIINTLSGALDIVDNEYTEALRNPNSLSPSSDIACSLSERGYLLPSKQAEDELFTEVYGKFTANQYKAPTMFVICPTYACNLRCQYCFEGKLTSEQTRILTREEVDAVFTAIAELTKETATIQLFGGEPFLPGTKDIVEYILECAVKRDYKISVVTNGVNLAAYMPLLLECKNNLSDFQVTVDGPADIHDKRRPKAGGQGTFAEIMAGIELALSNGLHIRMRVNADKTNIYRVVDLADYIIAREWDQLENFGALLSPVDDHTGGEVPNRLTEDAAATIWLELTKKYPQLSIFRADLWRNLDYLLTMLNTDKLSFPRFSYCESNNLGCYTFGTDGKIYVCTESIGNPASAIGTYFPDLQIFEDKAAIWNGRNVMTIEKCRQCEIATLCGGGCAYAALCINGSTDEPHCNGALETLHAYLESIKEDLLNR